MAEIEFNDFVYGVDIAARNFGIGLQEEYGDFESPWALLHQVKEKFGDNLDTKSLVKFLNNGKKAGIIVSNEPQNPMQNNALNYIVDVLQNVSIEDGEQSSEG